jgi:hypothetical protein
MHYRDSTEFVEALARVFGSWDNNHDNNGGFGSSHWGQGSGGDLRVIEEAKSHIDNFLKSLNQ